MPQASAFDVVPIPQRQDLPDKKRQKILNKIPAEQREFLPVTPATILVCGSIGAGKSSIMYSWLTKTFPGYYDEVIIFCGSIDSKEAFESVPQKRVCFLSDYDDAAFTNYINQLKADQQERLASGKRPLNICICFDDVVYSQSISSSGKKSMAEKVLLVARHELNATVIICVQSSKMMSPTIRNNCMYMIVPRVNRNDLDKISEEHSNHLSKQQFIDMYNDIMSKPHSFLLIDYKQPQNKRFKINWNNYYTGTSSNGSPLQEITASRPTD